jgi:Spy/CpxP family protein refolding chaperone
LKKRIFIIAMALLFIINITALATLSYNRWLKPWPRSDESWEELSLSPQQSQKMQNLRFSFEQEVESLRLQMRERRNALLGEARNPSPNLDRIDSLIEEIGVLQINIQKKSVRNLLKDKRVLTPGQQKKYFSLFQEHMDGQGHRYRIRGRGKGRRGPRWLREDQK